jgi:hypothetical protein
MPSDHDKEEICVCAAIKIDAQGGEDLIVIGRRHHNILSALNYAKVDWRTPDGSRREDGFMTNRGRFVTRKEGYYMQIRAEIPSANPDGYRHGLRQLFSEDLY